MEIPRNEQSVSFGLRVVLRSQIRSHATPPHPAFVQSVHLPASHLGGLLGYERDATVT